jgi:hypothetical protein
MIALQIINSFFKPICLHIKLNTNSAPCQINFVNFPKFLEKFSDLFSIGFPWLLTVGRTPVL